MIYDLIIIGAGPVGLYASFLSGYMKLKTLCIEIDDEIGGQPAKFYPTKPIYDFPCFNEITGEDLITKLHDQIKCFSEYTTIKTSTEIINYVINNDIITLVDKNNNEYQTKYVLFASNLGGCTPRKIHLENIKSNIVIDYYLQDKTKYKNQNVVVLGGGDSAVDHAIHIKKSFKPKSVTLVHRGTQLTTTTKSVQQIEQSGVKVFLNHNVSNILENKIILENNETKKENALDKIDNILVQFGVEIKPTTISMWEGFEKVNNKFVVNQYYQTSNEKFFAAGNCTYNPDKINMIVSGIAEATIAINKIKALLPNTKKVTW